MVLYQTVYIYIFAHKIIFTVSNHEDEKEEGQRYRRIKEEKEK